MSEQTSLLIELGTEELPVKALPGLAQAFFDGVIAALEKRGIGFERGDAKPLYTPRRLAVLLPAVDVEQPEQKSEVLGPYLNIALDANGAPTKALEGFAAKAGIDWTQLERTTDGKGERFVHRAVKPGARTADLLADIVREALAGMPIPKPMRWGDHDYAFARPVHWLVLLLGQDVVDAQLLCVTSDRMSRGHRFEHDKPVWIGQPDDYVDALRAARVLVDADARRTRIVEEVQQAAARAGGSARITDDNLEQVVCLTEWPSAVLCSFESAFLAVPQEALIETMEINQKFFPVLSDGGKLTEHFIGIANIESQDVDEVRKGYERVIRPRFSDAKFFFDEDLKQGLVSMGDGLKTVTYQAKLGSVADKVARVAALAETIAAQVGADPVQARKAAELAKNDLQSRMVNEFPELQGIAGRHYALAAGEPKEIALAIDEAYQPRFAGDDIALSPLGKVLAIAERLDTLAGGFAAGLKPTGNKDPFALRRNALGLARTVIESGFNISIKDLIAKSIASLPEAIQPHADRNTETMGTDLYDFILDRLRGYYADKGVPAAHFTAVAELKPPSLYDFDTRLDAIGTFATLPEADALAAANKRIGNILKKADIPIPHTIDRALLTDPAESALAEAVEAVIGETDEALHHHDYVTVLNHLARLRPQVDAFFDSVMVNADDPAVRANRLALLKRLADRFRAVAAIEHLSG
ncbi:glycine--tRNA ligase subunit beta [Pseudoxanthomonas sp. LH2527]|uniref:glycine--tRNA ligase subunit beta n=1 Tax=Pseudoxanthomonas sp. LH2527 TaxID=2923249 RepID=UPI001F131F3E|nr:glycine--tRNA ligase subunit beta [Pseudoxanthomonas sp. LH2527]MCH6483109.1 glycine--tRNA ligase subunit beta [Pseudoxanthomonas sp. LH2527]